MYIPLIIAIIMGLVSSSNQQPGTQVNRTVYISANAPANSVNDVPTDSTIKDDTGGENGSNPPR